MNRAILLLQCPDRPGLIAKLSNCIFSHGCNILKMNQYTTAEQGGRFFLRVEFCSGDDTESSALDGDLASLGAGLGATWNLYDADHKTRMAIAVSKFDHCLIDLLYRVRIGEIHAEVPFVYSNHDTLRSEVERHGIPFHHLPITPETKSEQEARVLELLDGNADLLVMARYMQILSNDFLNQFAGDVINIHHSFLPSFKGANPYKQAFDRGVKIIGATAHFASADLDEGPIIEQSVDRVSHSDTVDDLKSQGRTLEQTALARAVHAYVDHRVIRFENRTIVFE